MNETIMKLAGSYARVSTARQEEEQTIKTQLTAVKDVIQRQNLTLISEYLDEGWSGDILARPALDRLREDAKAKKWQVLVVYDPDRLARRYSYQELIMDELREAGVEIIFVTVSTPKNSEEKILHGVRGLFSEYERAKITERFRMGKIRKIREGHILVSEPPYGYDYVPKQGPVHGYYEVNKEEARVVRMMFDWIDQDGLTLRGIVRKLQDLRIKPRKSRRGVWATSTLSTLLKNRAYIGEARWGSSYAVVPENPKSQEKYRKIRKTSRRIKPVEEWMTVPVPSIVSKDVFTRVQHRVHANFLAAQRATKNEYLLAGLVYCVCGQKRAGEGPQKGKFLYYRCNDRVLSFPLPHKCKQKAIPARVADQLVWENVTALMSSPDLMQKQVKQWSESTHREPHMDKAAIESMEREIVKLNDQEDRYNKAYASGLFTLEQLKEYTIPLREKKLSYDTQIQDLKLQQYRATQSIVLPTEKELATFAGEAKTKLVNLNFESKRLIIRNVVEKVVGTKERISVHGFIPISNVKMFPNDRDDANTIRHFPSRDSAIPFRLDLTIASKLFGKAKAVEMKEDAFRKSSI